jgi:hypothetical protein
VKRADANAIFWLTLGTLFVPFIGWFIALFLLWKSSTWSQTEKVLGTLVWPVALIVPALIFFATKQTCGGDSCTRRPGWPLALSLAITVVPVVIIARLWRTARLEQASSRHAASALPNDLET